MKLFDVVIKKTSAIRRLKLCFMLSFFSISSCQGPSEADSNSVRQQREVRKEATINANVSPGEKSSIIPKEGLGSLPEMYSSLGTVSEYKASYQSLGVEQSGKKISSVYIEPVGKASDVAIIALHGESGLSDDFLKMLLAYTALGYSVLALDLYGYVPDTEKNALILEEFLNSVSESAILGKVNLAANFLKKKGASKIALMGWSSGGKRVTRLARLTYTRGDDSSSAHIPFVAAVNYYGRADSLLDYTESPNSQDERELNGVPYIGFFTLNDQNVSISSVKSLQDGFSAYKDISFNIVETVESGFMEPYSDSYHEATASMTLRQTDSFLRALPSR